MLAFDTHATVKELTSAGLSEPQAEAITSAVGRLRQADLADLATKADTAAIRSDVVGIRNDMATKADLTALLSDIKTDVAEFKADMARWMFGQTIVILGAVAAIMRLLGH